MSSYQLIEEINEQVRRHVMEMDRVSADKLGMDIRAGYRLYVDDECIVVDKDADRALQYYGGFEYVDKEYRQEMGDFVFYFRDDDRVNGHLETYESQEETEETE